MRHRFRSAPAPAVVLLAVVPLITLLLAGCEIFGSDEEAAEDVDAAAGTPEAAMLLIDEPGGDEIADAGPDFEADAWPALGQRPIEAAPSASPIRTPRASTVDAGLGAVTDLFRVGREAIVGTRTGFNYRVESLRGQYALVPVPEIVGRPPEPRPAPGTDPIPHSRGVRGNGSITAAWLARPTERHVHGVLGDAVEATELRVRPSIGPEHAVRLPDTHVFDDLPPRIVDLDRDGLSEVLVVRSSLTGGAALALYGVAGDALAELASTDSIGTPNRWLNPVGAGDFDGDGAGEVALVETPRVGGTLRVLDYRSGRFVEIASAPGYSNHAPGSTVLDLSVVLDWDGDGADDIAVPSADRRSMVLVALRDGKLVEIGRVAHDAEIVTPVVAASVDGDRPLELVYGLSDGRIVILDD